MLGDDVTPSDSATARMRARAPKVSCKVFIEFLPLMVLVIVPCKADARNCI